MTITVIGCLGAYPSAGEATSGYVIEHGGTKVLLECGSGVLAVMQQHLGLHELDAVVLSHYHADHSADLGCLQYAVMVETLLGRRDKPFTAWGPGEAERLQYRAYCQGRSYLELDSFQIGSLTFSTCKTRHDADCYAIRVRGGGKTFVFSGDTGYFPELAAFAAGANCFLCEASFYQEGKQFENQHLTAVMASRLASLAQAEQLVLTHLPHFGDPQQLVQLAETEYVGRVRLARPWLRVEL